MSGKACQGLVQGLVILGGNLEVICSLGDELGDELASPPSHHLDFCAPTPSNPPIFNFAVPPPSRQHHLAHTSHTSYTPLSASQSVPLSTTLSTLSFKPSTTPPLRIRSTVHHPTPSNTAPSPGFLYTATPQASRHSVGPELPGPHSTLTLHTLIE
ncbi:hypothetical protein BKA56DRAFT_51503 [Ilyonectria sp. MPI-CAGE-AT-0026]|nr:hypothetical protein BKA56DRAFT_51503 [Ilyonectria sp. MPI-CAGE-AT-0026]